MTLTKTPQRVARTAAAALGSAILKKLQDMNLFPDKILMQLQCLYKDGHFLFRIGKCALMTYIVP